MIFSSDSPSRAQATPLQPPKTSVPTSSEKRPHGPTLHLVTSCATGRSPQASIGATLLKDIEPQALCMLAANRSRGLSCASRNQSQTGVHHSQTTELRDIAHMASLSPQCARGRLVSSCTCKAQLNSLRRLRATAATAHAQREPDQHAQAHKTGTLARGTKGQARKEPTKTPSTRHAVQDAHTRWEPNNCHRQCITKYTVPTSRWSRLLGGTKPSRSTEKPTSRRSRLPILDKLPRFVTKCKTPTSHHSNYQWIAKRAVPNQVVFSLVPSQRCARYSGHGGVQLFCRVPHHPRTRLPQVSVRLGSLNCYSRSAASLQLATRAHLAHLDSNIWPTSAAA